MQGRAGVLGAVAIALAVATVPAAADDYSTGLQGSGSLHTCDCGQPVESLPWSWIKALCW